ncbi:MAG: MBL fold metallo-hydrolase [Phycisphaeraceae bacterium]|nr:MAG: MBL fold metallo-hydrolase [Phycisphaeraceae bacterium]
MGNGQWAIGSRNSRIQLPIAHCLIPGFPPMTWKWKLIRAGAFKLDAGAMFGVVPKPLWSRAVEVDDRNRMLLNTNCLLLERDGRRVLIETGIGDKSTDKMRDIYALENRSVRDALRDADCFPNDISTVIVTHLHFDHAGGLTTLSDSGDAVPLFPEAEVVTQRQEWEDALANKSTMHSTYLRNHLDPVADRVRQIAGDGEALPGIMVRPVPGHTWGQQAVFFQDAKGRTIVFPGDLMPTMHHVGLTYSMAYDQLPYENMIQKSAFLQEACDAGWLVALDHEPGAAVVRVERGDKPGAYRLVPLPDDEVGLW